MKLFMFGVVFFSLLSCKNGSGLLKVEEDITLKSKKGEVVFETGSYDVSLNYKKKLFSSKVKVELKAEGKDKVTFKVPKRVKLNRSQADELLKASEVGQNFDVKVNIMTKYSSSEPYLDTESCYETHSYKACHFDEEGKRVFTKKSLSLGGLQKVQFHYNYTDKYIDFALLKVESGDQVANFTGGDNSSAKIYDFKGKCHIKLSEKKRLRRAIRDSRCHN